MPTMPPLVSFPFSNVPSGQGVLLTGAASLGVPIDFAAIMALGANGTPLPDPPELLDDPEGLSDAIGAESEVEIATGPMLLLPSGMGSPPMVFGALKSDTMPAHSESVAIVQHISSGAINPPDPEPPTRQPHAPNPIAEVAIVPKLVVGDAENTAQWPAAPHSPLALQPAPRSDHAKSVVPPNNSLPLASGQGGNPPVRQTIARDVLHQQQDVPRKEMDGQPQFVLETRSAPADSPPTAQSLTSPVAPRAIETQRPGFSQANPDREAEIRQTTPVQPGAPKPVSDPEKMSEQALDPDVRMVGAIPERGNSAQRDARISQAAPKVQQITQPTNPETQEMPPRPPETLIKLPTPELKPVQPVAPQKIAEFVALTPRFVPVPRVLKQDFELTAASTSVPSGNQPQPVARDLGAPAVGGAIPAQNIQIPEPQKWTAPLAARPVGSQPAVGSDQPIPQITLPSQGESPARIESEVPLILPTSDRLIQIADPVIGSGRLAIVAPDAPRLAVTRDIAQQLSVQIEKTTFGPTEITLAPEELGKVRLVLKPVEAGLVLQIIAERPETTDLMRRNIETLAQEFRDLGYKSLSFEFSDTRQDSKPEFRQDPRQDVRPEQRADLRLDQRADQRSDQRQDQRQDQRPDQRPGGRPDSPADPAQIAVPDFVPAARLAQSRGAGVDLRL